MYFRVFFEGQGTEWGIFFGLLKFQIFFGVLEIMIFFFFWGGGGCGGEMKMLGPSLYMEKNQSTLSPPGIRASLFQYPKLL